ncbi:fumarylacetoacetate hydrolase family protein [Tenacibaculum finnmarkense genomovar finnmarkense]|uniref:2-hydroxyhepta-2,4-diene-1,7-dioate isomerase n=1 Tax=Tenacibaculum finnmarkense genomovar finnmarkense TaxID=1458503 RepID=A0AAP1RG16_9FLAO|nr:fumarylacetoacetate hydrolase family protein [Tenacibaculum finnmarkense]MBE7653086.1 2-hydroxyhepta-2,4-diene-1,7-dioate isomerase [Tenacibaculum finnmarkense genomovar finnmarkense]MBE7660665.1 2-hydroxyhepta-2,4-diene-1,7-dioate isomerase [Tenacibaculum finnmarkense genomovar finnmarkense]MBE7693362.1 2-hydroxyhepta-2,4-diene-1,7-dioate isomerase [Tenacibaculum finnmarkense genomovar finnmarkense]MBE7695387.1 2-hydroxyhepta-2,4-diene-1,7-dioate isomerase [Tenacibaculum finnmarkense genomo
MKIICIGRNYAKHIEELANEKPESPVVFLKPDSAILPKKMPFFIPPFSDDIHYEVEVLVKINKVGKHISSKFAHKYYDEIGLGIDFTARDVQATCKEKGLPWEKAKAFDGSAVIGNFYPKEEFNLESISFQLHKNDEVVQDGNSETMLWKIDELISYVSQYFTLKKGDVIFTGTPAGVGRVVENDVLTGVIEGKQAFNIKIK